MNDHDTFFRRMTQEAMEDLTSGKQGWREVSPNVLTLACFGMLYNHLSSKIVKPLWFFTASVMGGVTWYVVREILGLL